MEASGAVASSEQDPPLASRLLRIAAWIGGVALTILVLDQVGIPVYDWIDDLFDKLAELPPGRSRPESSSRPCRPCSPRWSGSGSSAPPSPGTEFRFRLVLASYAAAVALNGFLPANIGTFVMLVMFTTLIAGATFAMMVSALVVEKIPFSLFNVAVYLYLFLSVSGSFSVKLGFLTEHRGWWS